MKRRDKENAKTPREEKHKIVEIKRKKILLNSRNKKAESAENRNRRYKI